MKDTSNNILLESNLNLPDKLYHGSKHKLVKLDKGSFLTPHMGIASIFIVDKKELSQYTKSIKSYNIGYEQWDWEDSQLQTPLKYVNITHNIKKIDKTFYGESSGYIYEIDISKIKNKFKTFVTNDANREVVYIGNESLSISNVITHSLKWDFKFSQKDANEFGVAESSNILNEAASNNINRLQPRILEKEDIDYLLNLKRENITTELAKELFAYTSKKNPRFSPQDKFTLSPNAFYNKEVIVTTVGKFIFNKFVFHPEILSQIGYINKSLNAKAMGKVDSDVISLLKEKKITRNIFNNYIDSANLLGYGWNSFLASSFEYDFFVLDELIEKKKIELLDQYAEELRNNDPVIAGKIADELIKLTIPLIQNMDSYEIFDSGARGSVGNNYKNMVIMRGAIANITKPGEFMVSTSSLVGGIPKEEYEHFANMLVEASFSRATETANGGYLGKQMLSAYQSLKLDDKDTNCNSRKYLELILTDDMATKLEYRYIMDGVNLVRLDKDNFSKYVGKKIKLRSPMYCRTEKICNICGGDAYYMQDILNFGLLANRIGTAILNMALKKFHDSTVKISKIKVEDYISKL